MKNQNRIERKNSNESFNLLSADTEDPIKKHSKPFEELIDVDHLNKLKSDKEISEYLFKVAYSTDSVEKFIDYFYPENKEDDLSTILKPKEFTSIGIFENLSFLPLWLGNEKLSVTSQILKEKFNYTYWRRIKGDGNCYYRAVLINYIELLLINSLQRKNPEIFFSLIKDVSFTKFPSDKEKSKKLCLIVLMAIYNNLLQSITDKNSENSSPSSKSICFDILYRSYNKSDIIEKSLILWLRLKLTNFLKENLEMEFDGLKLIQFIPGLELKDDSSYDKNIVYKYIDNNLMKMNEYVEGYPIYITPIILNVDTNIFYIDNDNIPILVDVKYNKNIHNKINHIESYLFDISAEGYLNEIGLLFRVPHYDNVYNSDIITKILGFYDNPYLALMEGQFDQSEYMIYKSEVLSEKKTRRLETNPLTGLISHNEQNKEISKANQININKIELNESNSDKNKSILKSNKINELDNRKIFIAEYNTCTVCDKTFEELVYYPCNHSFCISCFELYFNFYLNRGNSLRYDIRKIKHSNEITYIFKNEYRFKFFKCLFDKCDLTFDKFSILEKIFQRYQTISKSQSQIRIHNNNKENKIEKKVRKTEEKDKSNIIQSKYSEGNSKFCRKCKKQEEYLFISDGCEVCKECQRKSLTLSSKNDSLNKKRVKYNCIGCGEYVLTYDDYLLFFDEQEISKYFNK